MLLFNIILIGEALADGSTIPWKHFNAFDGMTEDQIQNDNRRSEGSRG